MAATGPGSTLSRAPSPALRPFVSLIWASDGAEACATVTERELVLPSGAMHLVVRIDEAPVRAWSGAEAIAIPSAVIGGIRHAAYQKEARSTASVGVMLRTGAAAALLRAPGALFAQRHTSLGALWPTADIDALRDRLAAASGLAARLTTFEAELERRLTGAPVLDPFITHAARWLERGVAIAEIVREAGCSHRHFTSRFHEAVGVAPKTYQRLARFNRALDHLHARPTTALADIAATHDYADQAHLTREFRDFAGITPDRFRRLAPANARHVPIAA